MEVIVVATAEAACLRAARIVGRLLRAKPDAALALPTGNTPRALYAELGRLHRDAGLSFARASAFALDEYVGLGVRSPGRLPPLYGRDALPPDQSAGRS